MCGGHDPPIEGDHQLLADFNAGKPSRNECRQDRAPGID